MDSFGTVREYFSLNAFIAVSTEKERRKPCHGWPNAKPNCGRATRSLCWTTFVRRRKETGERQPRMRSITLRPTSNAWPMPPSESKATPLAVERLKVPANGSSSEGHASQGCAGVNKAYKVSCRCAQSY